MKKFKNYTINDYLNVLAAKEPVPGGGSVAALTAASAAGLISMVANYSKGKSKSKAKEKKIADTLKKSEKIRKRLISLVDLDAAAYLKVVKARKGSAKAKRAAKKAARDVPMEVGRLCYDALKLTPTLVKDGNKYLLSDIEVAVELLLASYNSAMINVEINK